MKKELSHVIEAKRAIEDFMSKVDRLTSRGELNSDGVKALTRIIKLLNRSGMRSDASKLSRRLKDHSNLEMILSTLSQIEEKLG
ncbi:MAG: hypothetical protein DRJ60_01015 [Thermoprotei archaeon]|nr:MAG: hypothetical protein DRJ60_01015 [Thermoprotei archaeon]